MVGLNAPKASAARIAAMKDRFKQNGVYPFHVMYDTGLAEELKDLILGKGRGSLKRVGCFSDWSDRFMEYSLRKPGTLIWEEMKQDADDAFVSWGAGTESVKYFLKYLKKAAQTGLTKEIHVVATFHRHDRDRSPLKNPAKQQGRPVKLQLDGPGLQR